MNASLETVAIESQFQTNVFVSVSKLVKIDLMKWDDCYLPLRFSASFLARASSNAEIKSGQSRFSSGSHVLSSEL